VAGSYAPGTVGSPHPGLSTISQAGDRSCGCGFWHSREPAGCRRACTVRAQTGAVQRRADSTEPCGAGGCRGRVDRRSPLAIGHAALGPPWPDPRRGLSPARRGEAAGRSANSYIAKGRPHSLQSRCGRAEAGSLGRHAQETVWMAVARAADPRDHRVAVRGPGRVVWTGRAAWSADTQPT